MIKMMVRIERSDIEEFINLIEAVYDEDTILDRKFARIPIMETDDRGFAIKYKNIIKKIGVVGLEIGFDLSYKQLKSLLDTYYQEKFIVFEIEDNKDEWMLKLRYRDNTIKVDRNTYYFKFNHDIKFEISKSELVNILKNNEEFQFIKGGFNTKNIFKVKFNPNDKANLLYFILTNYGDNYIIVKIMYDYDFLFEMSNGTYFNIRAEDLDYIKEV